MDVLDDIRAVKDIIAALLKAKKTFRLYPESNPMYTKLLDDTYVKFKTYLDYKDQLTIKIKQNELFLDSEQIYHNPEKEDNLALFLFKDGIREITFKKGFAPKELEDFLKILTVDYDREVLDDDVVTLLWEKDFQNIKYAVDEAFLTEDDGYETKAVNEVKGAAEEGYDNLTRAYSEAFGEDAVSELSVVPLSDKDLQTLVIEIEKDSHDKLPKLIALIFEVLYQAESTGDYEDVIHFLRGTVEYSITHGNIEAALGLMNYVQSTIDSSDIPDEVKKHLKTISLFLGSDTCIKLLGEFLNSGIEFEEKTIEEYAKYLDKSAIQPLMGILGDLKTIPGRKAVINALVVLGKKDMQAIAKGLYDTRWYVVRNVIYVLGKIGDKKSVDFLLKTLNHSDIRVRKEVIKSLGGMGSLSVLSALRDCLDDTDEQIRTASARAIANIPAPSAKSTILNHLSDKSFNKAGINEKKEFYEVLSRWKDPDVIELLVRTLNKKSFFRRASNDENRACAAYCLGLIGNKDVLPVLYKARDSKSRIVWEYVDTAIKRIEYGR